MNYLSRYLKQWIARLSQPRVEFNNNAACPFSSRAQVTTVTISDHADLAGLLRCVRLDPWRVLVALIDYPDAEEIRKVLRVMKPVLAERDLLALPSDPGHPMIVSGFRTTQETYFLVIVQRKSELERASLELQKRGYYKNWTAEQLRWLEDRE